MHQAAATDPILAVTQLWRQQGISLLPPLADQEVDQLFAPVQDRISLDLRQLYALTGGMAEGETDDEYWSLWTPERLIAEAEPAELFFGDFLIDSHLHVLEWESAETSSVHVFHGHNHRVRVADSILAFFELYLCNPFAAVHGF